MVEVKEREREIKREISRIQQTEIQEELAIGGTALVLVGASRG